MEAPLHRGEPREDRRQLLSLQRALGGGDWRRRRLTGRLDWPAGPHGRRRRTEVMRGAWRDGMRVYGPMIHRFAVAIQYE